MNNEDSTAYRLALFNDQTPADTTESIGLLADFLAAINLDEVSDHPGLSMIHEIIRDSLGALGQRLRQPAM